MPSYLDPRDNERFTSTRGYETSKYQNRLAEIAHQHVLDGDVVETLYDGDSVAFDLVRCDLLDDGTSDYVALRYDSQGFVDIEWNGSALEWSINGERHWHYLQHEYELAAHEFHGGAAGSFASEGCSLCPQD